MKVTFSGIIIKCVKQSFPECPGEDQVPAACRGDLISVAHFIGGPPFPVSFPHSLTLSRDHLPSKLLTPQSSTQTLLWGTNQDRDLAWSLVFSKRSASSASYLTIITFATTLALQHPCVIQDVLSLLLV